MLAGATDGRLVTFGNFGFKREAFDACNEEATEGKSGNVELL